MKVYIFGNGNISFEDFEKFYLIPLKNILEQKEIQFLLCDFRGVETLMMEYLKTETSDVSVYHIGEKPRYLPDKYRTKVSSWKIIGGFESDEERDKAAIENCDHFLAVDFNSNEKRKSETLKNIEFCQKLGKIRIE